MVTPRGENECMALPGDPEFLEVTWRKRPTVYRKYVPYSKLKELRSDCLLSWAQPPATARIFVEDDHGIPGASLAREIPSPQLAMQIFQKFQSCEAVTLLFNHVERIDIRVRELQQSFGIPYSWRIDNAVATFSTPTSGIGYHAGHEDGFIVQVEGVRHWRVWSKSLLSSKYRRYLLRGGIDVPSEPRPSASPIVDCMLSAGDVLYLPALFPHEGITEEESISLSLGWKGISTYHALLALAERPDTISTLQDRYLDLIPDFLAIPTSIEHAANTLGSRFSDSGINIKRSKIEAYLWKLASKDFLYE